MSDSPRTKRPKKADKKKEHQKKYGKFTGKHVRKVEDGLRKRPRIQ